MHTFSHRSTDVYQSKHILGGQRAHLQLRCCEFESHSSQQLFFKIVVEKKEKDAGVSPFKNKVNFGIMFRRIGKCIECVNTLVHLIKNNLLSAANGRST